jgi:hypothetical protein
VTTTVEAPGVALVKHIGTISIAGPKPAKHGKKLVLFGSLKSRKLGGQADHVLCQPRKIRI